MREKDYVYFISHTPGRGKGYRMLIMVMKVVIKDYFFLSSLAMANR
jgi:hypothetical protein